MLNINLTEEQYVEIVDELLSALTKETEQKLPDKLTIKQKRWLLDGLMEMRTAGDLDDHLIDLQNKLLSYENEKSGVNKVSLLKFSQGEAVIEQPMKNLDADIVVLFAPNLLCLADEISANEKSLLLAAGMQVNEQFANMISENRNVQKPSRAYICAGFNLPTKFIAKILVHENSTPADFSAFCLALKDLYNFAKQNNAKTIAFDIAGLTKIDTALIEVLKREFKIFKKNKIKIILCK